MIVVDWGDADETLIVWRFEQRWKLNHYFKAVDTMALMANSKRHSVYAIIDLRRATRIPPRPLSIASYGIMRRPRNLALSVAISTMVPHQQIFASLERWSAARYIHLVGHVDDAYNLIERHQNGSGDLSSIIF